MVETERVQKQIGKFIETKKTGIKQLVERVLFHLAQKNIWKLMRYTSVMYYGQGKPGLLQLKSVKT